MPLIPEDIIVAVRESTDIVSLIGRYVRSLKSSGKNYKGLCPFHDEKTPSFTVNPERQTFRCYGCGEGGNAIHFLMKIEGVTFPDAVKQLAKESNIVIPERADPNASKREEYYRVNNWVGEWFRYEYHTNDGKKARDYVQRRKINDEMSDTFQIGYAPSGWDRLLKASQEKELPLESLVALGLIVRKENEGKQYDFYRDRLMFPIHDQRGRIVGFGGRELDGSQVKYINSPESEIFKKSFNLYGLYQGQRALRRDSTAILVEGYTDVIMCHQYGFENAVAALGTAFTKDHAKVLKRYVDKVVLCLDADEAGQRAALRALPILLRADIEVKIALLEGVKDPCDFLTQNGKEAFAESMKSATDCVDFYFGKLENKGPDQVHATVKALGQLISMIPSPILKELYMGKISELTKLKEETLKGLIVESEPEPEPKIANYQEIFQNSPKNTETQVPEAEFGALAAMIAHPKKAQIIIESLSNVELTHPLIIRMISNLYEHITGSPDTTPALCAAIFQDESEMALVTKYEEMAKDRHWMNFLGCLKVLKEEKMKTYERLALEARRAGDKVKHDDFMRKYYELSRDLKANPK